MATTAHFIDVGQGNMTLLQLADGTIMLYDCNVTDENGERVLAYLGSVLPRRAIDIFVNSHRDADHMRGIKRVHRKFPISKIWDCDVAGETPDSTEYREYMDLRRALPTMTLEPRKYWDFSRTRVRAMNAKNPDVPDTPNAQSIVLKVQHQDTQGNVLSSIMLTGDTEAVTWKRGILPHYQSSSLKSSILLASHHGSITFFDDPSDRYYYLDHIKQIDPEMTIISVGPNVHGHPDSKAMEFYERYSSGSDKGNKVYRTDQQGTMLIWKDRLSSFFPPGCIGTRGSSPLRFGSATGTFDSVSRGSSGISGSGIGGKGSG